MPENNNKIYRFWLAFPCYIHENAVYCWERTTDMSHVDGVDDGVGYGASGRSNSSVGVYDNSSFDYAAILDRKVKITGNLEKAGCSVGEQHLTASF
ncbi:MAG TPA: hypothetical protein VFY41_04435 [Nitrososphaeraceae archaeon]|nr:hypothetical protein [Nitrososphaeraceae archaeon]